MTPQTPLKACVQIGAVVVVPAAITLACHEVGFGYNVMWWVTAALTTGLIMLEAFVAFILLVVNDRFRRNGLRATVDPEGIPQPWHEKGVFTTLFILVMLFALDMDALMLVYALVWVSGQLGCVALRNTLTAIYHQQERNGV